MEMVGLNLSCIICNILCSKLVFNISKHISKNGQSFLLNYVTKKEKWGKNFLGTKFSKTLHKSFPCILK